MPGGMVQLGAGVGLGEGAGVAAMPATGAAAIRAAATPKARQHSRRGMNKQCPTRDRRWGRLYAIDFLQTFGVSQPVQGQVQGRRLQPSNLDQTLFSFL